MSTGPGANLLRALPLCAGDCGKRLVNPGDVSRSGRRQRFAANRCRSCFDAMVLPSITTAGLTDEQVLVLAAVGRRHTGRDRNLIVQMLGLTGALDRVISHVADGFKVSA